MLYFGCKSFFDYYLFDKTHINHFISNFPTNNGTHQDAVNDLLVIDSPSALRLANKIQAVKNCITVNFYFSYALMSEWKKIYPNLTKEEAETYTKIALQKINIFTYGKVDHKSIYKNHTSVLGISEAPLNIDIDISNIVHTLVNNIHVPLSTIMNL